MYITLRPKDETKYFYEGDVPVGMLSENKLITQSWAGSDHSTGRAPGLFKMIQEPRHKTALAVCLESQRITDFYKHDRRSDNLLAHIEDKLFYKSVTPLIYRMFMALTPCLKDKICVSHDIVEDPTYSYVEHTFEMKWEPPQNKWRTYDYMVGLEAAYIQKVGDSMGTELNSEFSYLGSDFLIAFDCISLDPQINNLGRFEKWKHIVMNYAVIRKPSYLKT